MMFVCDGSSSNLCSMEVSSRRGNRLSSQLLIRRPSSSTPALFIHISRVPVEDSHNRHTTWLASPTLNNATTLPVCARHIYYAVSIYLVVVIEGIRERTEYVTQLWNWENHS